MYAEVLLAPARRSCRPLFVATILTGSFLLFLIQPMVARMALPRLGGAPNVWNSAMLVYQALLLCGYLYAHLLSRMPLRRQATVHLALLLFGAVSLPVGLVALPLPAPGWEVLWVPLLLALSVGPVFLLVSAQAPLMQRWYAADPAAGEPWALYAASNLGSFAGLIAYPLLAEPWLRLHQQSLVWSAGYGALIVLVALTARARWRAPRALAPLSGVQREGLESIPATRILLWLALAAVPSGLMLSTTTHLTTDLFAMPLLWVIPLGLYLLSFVIAFAERRWPARAMVLLTPPVVLLAGGYAMVSRSYGGMGLALASVALLLFVAVALHTRLYEARPGGERLTLFYLVMSAGGALGGAFTALLAPVVFDWVWEHPLLVFAAALLIPLPKFYNWARLDGLEPGMARVGIAVLLLVAAFLAWLLLGVTAEAGPGLAGIWLTVWLLLIGLLLVPWRWAFAAVLAMTMVAQGGAETFWTSWEGLRSRSYFGIYTLRDYPEQHIRTLAHGTTLHGQQSTDPIFACAPMSYYGPGSGAAITLDQAPAMFGRNARIGVVGLGTGTLAAFHQPGERWTFYEIDPAVVRFSQQRRFTFIARCAPDARIVIGDARLALAKVPPGSLDVLAVDAFSSDTIPLHLLTDEAIGVYLRALAPSGVLLVHISNRYIELEPVLAAAAKERRLAAEVRDDMPQGLAFLTASSWVAMSRDPASLKALAGAQPDAPWDVLQPPAPRVWTDDHASILPYIRWYNLLGKR
ncbi:MAG: fused MFS/spermidine synthase [Novosphingobium sp.]